MWTTSLHLFRLHYSPTEVGVYILQDNPTGQSQILAGEWRPREIGAYCEPSVIVDAKALQATLDQLWAMGLRPSGWAHEGEVKALREHLEDLRKLVPGLTGTTLRDA